MEERRSSEGGGSAGGGSCGGGLKDYSSRGNPGTALHPSASVASIPKAAATDMVMAQAGTDIQGLDLDRLANKRMKRGECPNCATKLFEMKGFMARTKVPLTVENKVLNGRCLQCFPLRPATPQSPRLLRNSPSQQPRPTVQATAVAAAVATPMVETAQVEVVRSPVQVQPGTATATPDYYEGEPTFVPFDLMVPRRPVDDDNISVVSGLTMDAFDDPPIISLSAGGGAGGRLFPASRASLARYTNPSGGGLSNVAGARRPSGSFRASGVGFEGADEIIDEDRESSFQTAAVAAARETLGADNQHNMSGRQLRVVAEDTGSYMSGDADSAGRSGSGSAAVQPEPTMQRESSSAAEITFRLNSPKKRTNQTFKLVPPDQIHRLPTNSASAQGRMPTMEAHILEERNSSRHLTSEDQKEEIAAFDSRPAAAISPAMQKQPSRRNMPHDDPMDDDDMGGRPARSNSLLLAGPGGGGPGGNRRPPAASFLRDDDDVGDHRRRSHIPAVPIEHAESGVDFVSLLSTLEQPSSSLPTERLAALETITNAIWEGGTDAKKRIVDLNGLETVKKTIWNDMGQDPSIVRAALELVLALAASVNEDPTGDVLAGDTAESLIDAFLIAMDNLKEDYELQPLGFRILCCLASASSNNPSVVDGTRSGAVLTVLSAMDIHSDNLEVQEWGVRALYGQCASSGNAESNKRTLANLTLARGELGVSVLQKILSNFPEDELVVEWACKLFSCLTDSEDVAEKLSPCPNLIQDLIRILSRAATQPNGLHPVHEAALDTLSNLTRIEQNNEIPSATDLVLLSMQMMRVHSSRTEVLVEACCIIANVSTSSFLDKNEVLKAGIFEALIGLASNPNFVKDETVCHSILRGLLAMCRGSEDVKQALRDPNILHPLLKFCASNADSIVCQEYACRFFSAVFCSERARNSKALKEYSLDYICHCMKHHSDSEKLQDTACLALRSLTGMKRHRETMIRSEVPALVMGAMAKYTSCKTIQVNVSAILWNLAMVDERKEMQIDERGIECIVRSIQTHLDSDSILELACGAIWSLFQGSDELKMALLRVENGVETIISVLILHADKPPLLENALGILATLSVNQQLAQTIADLGGVANTVDVMRNNPHSVLLLQYAVHFIRNVVVNSSEPPKEAIDAIAVVVGAMKKYSEVAEFQCEACNFLWACAALSAESKSKILDVDGAQALNSVLQHHSGVEVVESAALGAFREIAL